MTHYYFDYRHDAGIARDEVGLELDSLDQAIMLAKQALADVISDETVKLTAEPARITIAIDVRIEEAIVYTAVAMAADLKVEGPAER